MAGLWQASVGLVRGSKTRLPGSSRLSRQIVAWVFLSLLVIEGIVFVPSYMRRRREELRNLEQVSEELLFALKASAMGGQDIDAAFSLVQGQFNPDSVVQGVALYKPDGMLLRQFGDAPELDVTNLGADEMRRQLNAGRSRYDVAWPSSQFQGQYVLVVRHDASQIGQIMMLYAAAIAGL
ncbi:MAG: adenylate/guanylate cyclase domain-containing protein, partial [Cyanobacteria bacterium J06638_6]